ncbi:MAG: hypothetical protein GY940_19700 [bacterium]|nr:hypothetical protein [bacterium]
MKMKTGASVFDVHYNDIAKNGTLALAPGSYGEIFVRANATLILTGSTVEISLSE